MASLSYTEGLSPMQALWENADLKFVLSAAMAFVDVRAAAIFGLFVLLWAKHSMRITRMRMDDTPITPQVRSDSIREGWQYVLLVGSFTVVAWTASDVTFFGLDLTVAMRKLEAAAYLWADLTLIKAIAYYKKRGPADESLSFVETILRMAGLGSLVNNRRAQSGGGRNNPLQSDNGDRSHD